MAQRTGVTRKRSKRIRTKRARRSRQGRGLQKKEGRSRRLSRKGPLYDQGYDNGHTVGFHEGYGAGLKSGGKRGSIFEEGRDAGYNDGYDNGLKNGKHEGGDGIVDRILPAYQVMPDTTIEQIVAAGVTALQDRVIHLLSVEQTGDRILTALEDGTPLSLVRLGDGELLTLAQEIVMPIEQVRAEGNFLGYAGVNVPDLAVRDRLIGAVMRAGIVGIPKLRLPNYQPLATAVFLANGIDIRTMNLSDSLVNYYLYQSGYLSRMTKGRCVLIIGNLADRLAEVLTANGVRVVGTVSPVEGVSDADRVIEAAMRFDFDLALVSAGISAVLISEHIATVMGKVAIDFGHLADSIVKGEAPFQ